VKWIELVFLAAGGIVAATPACAAGARHAEPAIVPSVPPDGAAPSSGRGEAAQQDPAPAVDFPGFDRGEEFLVEAAAEVAGIVDQLRLAHAGEIDADTAYERIELARGALSDIRAQWRQVPEERRRGARARRAEALARIGARLDEALGEYTAGPNVDYRIVHHLAEPPSLADFIREPPVETFNGVYRSGFEASDFYAFGNEGPWWLETTAENWRTLQSYLVQAGRGSSVTVALSITGWRDTEGRYGHLDAYATRVYVETIERIRAITPEEFERAVGRER
jgi:hypothetical protein